MSHTLSTLIPITIEHRDVIIQQYSKMAPDSLYSKFQQAGELYCSYDTVKVCAPLVNHMAYMSRLYEVGYGALVPHMRATYNATSYMYADKQEEIASFCDIHDLTLQEFSDWAYNSFMLKYAMFSCVVESLGYHLPVLPGEPPFLVDLNLRRVTTALSLPFIGVSIACGKSYLIGEDQCLSEPMRYLFILNDKEAYTIVGALITPKVVDEPIHRVSTPRPQAKRDPKMSTFLSWIEGKTARPRKAFQAFGKWFNIMLQKPKLDTFAHQLGARRVYVTQARDAVEHQSGEKTVQTALKALNRAQRRKDFERKFGRAPEPKDISGKMTEVEYRKNLWKLVPKDERAKIIREARERSQDTQHESGFLDFILGAAAAFVAGKTAQAAHRALNSIADTSDRVGDIIGQLRATILRIISEIGKPLAFIATMLAIFALSRFATHSILWAGVMSIGLGWFVYKLFDIRLTNDLVELIAGTSHEGFASFPIGMIISSFACLPGVPQNAVKTFATFATNSSCFGKVAENFGEFMDIVTNFMKEAVNTIATCVFRKDGPVFDLSARNKFNTWQAGLNIFITDFTVGALPITPELKKRVETYFYELDSYQTYFKAAPGFAQKLANNRLALRDISLAVGGALSCTGVRPQPVMLTLAGEPGIGKTTLIPMIARYFLLAAGKINPSDDVGPKTKAYDSHVFAKSSSVYWEGYMGQCVYIMDDFLQKLDPVASDGNAINDVIHMVGTAPLPLDMANASAKGKSYFVSDFIIATTNIYDASPMVSKQITTAGAFERRTEDSYKLALVPEFRTAKGTFAYEKYYAAVRRKEIGVFDAWTAQRFTLMGNNDRGPVEPLSVAISQCAKQHRERRTATRDIYALMNQVDEQFSAHACPTEIEVEPLPARPTARDNIEHESGEITMGPRPDYEFDDFFRHDPCKETGQELDAALLEYFPSCVFPHVPGRLPHDLHGNLPPYLALRAFILRHGNKEDNLKLLRKALYERARLSGDDFIFDIDLTNMRTYRTVASMCQKLFVLAYYNIERGVMHLGKFHIPSFGPFEKVNALLLVALGARIMPTATMDGKLPEIWATISPDITGISTAREYAERVCVEHNSMEQFAEAEECYGTFGRFWRSRFRNAALIAAGIGALAFVISRYISRGEDEYEDDEEVEMQTDTGLPKYKLGKSRKGHVQRRTHKGAPPTQSVAHENGLEGVKETAMSKLLVRTGEAYKNLEGASLKVLRNTYKIFSIRPGNVISSPGFGYFIKGGVFMYPYHFFKDWKMPLRTNPSLYEDNGYLIRLVNVVDPTESLDFRPMDFLHGFGYELDVSRDIAMVRLDVREHADIMGSFVCTKKTVELDSNTECVIMVHRGSSPTTMSRIVLAGEFRPNQTEAIVASGSYAEHAIYSNHTISGDCGAPVFAYTNGFNQRVLVGMHSARNHTRGVGMCPMLTRGHLETMAMNLGVTKAVSHESASSKEIAALAGIVYEVKSTDVLLADSGENFKVWGHATKPVIASTTSRITKSVLGQAEVFSAIVEETRKPARLGAFEKGGTTIYPALQALATYGTPNKPLDMCVIGPCVIDAMSRFTEASKHNTRTIFTFEEAVRGVPELGLQGIPRDTSAGYPWSLTHKNGKKDFFGYGEEYEFTSPSCAKLRERVDTLQEEILGGERPLFIYQFILKDELRSAEKVEKGATRAISAAPVDLTILTKMYFGAFAASFFANRVESGNAPGLNYFTEWARIVRHLHTRNKESFFDGDFKGLDSTEMVDVHNVILEYINSWYDDEHGFMRRMLWQEITNSNHIAGKQSPFNELYSWCHCLPSGHPLTTIVNTIYVMTAFAYAFRRAKQDHPIPFKKYVSVWQVLAMLVYGDDNIGAVIDDMKEFLNPLIFQKYFAELGLVYTPADKTSEVFDFKPLEECTFLKRGFQFDPEIGEWLAPLTLQSALCPMYWQKRERTELEKVQLVETALGESSLHGNGVFEAVREVLIPMAEGLGIAIRTRPRYECVQMCEEFEYGKVL